MMEDWQQKYTKLEAELGGFYQRLDHLERRGIVDLNALGLNVNVPAANQIRNGDLSHSVNTWSDETAITGDRNKECVYWFSHDAPTPGQQLNDAFNPTSPNKTLKTPEHSGYDSAYADWDVSKGVARLTGTKTVDAPFPQNTAIPNSTEEIVFTAARRNKFIEIPDTFRLFAGVWDNTTGQRDWLSDNFTATAAVVGTPIGTIERKYRVFVETDKGITYLSDEITVSNAPNDVSFGSSNVLLRWKQVEGVLRYIVYRHTPSTNTYLKLEEVSNGSQTYIDLNTSLAVVGSYPSATFTARKAVYYTNLGGLISLAIDGVSGQWDTIAFPIVIPENYNQGNTTDKQWIRIGQTEPLNLLIPNCTTNSNSTVDLPESLLEAAHIGLTVELSDGTNAAVRTISAQTGNSLTLSSPITWSNSITEMRVIGGGFHGVLLDLVHVCYQKGAQFAPHAEDIKTRTLQAAAKPNGSNRGGTGTGGNEIVVSGGSGDYGGIRCVTLDTPIKLTNCVIPICQIHPKEQVASGNLRPNLVNKIIDGFDYVREVQAENGAFIKCTDSHRFITTWTDEKGIPLYRLKVGDSVLTENDGKVEPSKIKSISAKSATKVPVKTLSLINGHFYLAGEYRPVTRVEKIKAYLDKWLMKKTKNLFFISHNRKYYNWDYYIE